MPASTLRRCACGCGRTLKTDPRQQYFNSSHRVRGYRQRQAAQLYPLPEALQVDGNIPRGAGVTSLRQQLATARSQTAKAVYEKAQLQRELERVCTEQGKGLARELRRQGYGGLIAFLLAHPDDLQLIRHRLTWKYHPDRNPSRDGQEMRLINWAFDELKQIVP